MRKQFSKKEIKEFLEKHPKASEFMTKKSKVIQEDNNLFVEGKPLYKRHEDMWIPSLTLLQKQNILPNIVVDKGTPPFIAKGADLMRPGVVSVDEFEKDSIVTLRDQTHNFPLATGKALCSSQDMIDLDKGKVVKIIHNLNS